jgi:hypothetical protein
LGDAFWKSSLSESTPNLARAAHNEEKTSSMILTFSVSKRVLLMKSGYLIVFG